MKLKTHVLLVVVVVAAAAVVGLLLQHILSELIILSHLYFAIVEQNGHIINSLLFKCRGIYERSD